MSSVGRLRKELNWPAKECCAESSPAAEDRTAMGATNESKAAMMSRPIPGGNGASAINWPMAVDTASSFSGAPPSSGLSVCRCCWMAGSKSLAARNAAKARTPSTRQAGTGRPSRWSWNKCSPLPPASRRANDSVLSGLTSIGAGDGDSEVQQHEEHGRDTAINLPERRPVEKPVGQANSE